MTARSIVLDHPDGPMRLYEATPDGPARGAVIVVQEAFGVNGHIEDVTRRFAGAGYHAVAPDLFHRAGGGTADYGDWSSVLPLFEGLDGDEAILRDIDAALDHLRAAGWAEPRIGVVGFCLGGRISFLVSLRRPLGAGVSFYGGGIVTGRFPQFPPLIDEAGGLTVPWLGLFGDLDTSIPVEDVEQLRAVLVGAPAETEIMRYPAAGHGFHCDQRPDYVEADAHDAWDRTLAWFGRYLSMVEITDHPDVGRADLGRYEIAVDDHLAGFSEYQKVGDRVVFVHTEIDPEFAGKGLGARLTRFALDDVRHQGLSATPQCPFMARYIRRHPEYVDLIDDAHRAPFEP